MEEVVVPWLFLRFGLYNDRPREGVWISNDGIRITGKGARGAPFGSSRVILLFLAQRAAELGPVVRGSLRDICTMFGMNWRKSRSTLENHLRRVIESDYEEVEPSCPCCQDSCHRGQRLDFIERAYYCSTSGNFEITLHPGFVEEIQRSPRSPLARVREFILEQQFAALDLHIWYRWAEHIGLTDVDPFGEDGPYRLLSIACAGPKQRSDLRARHKIVARIDPDTPFQLVGRGAIRRILWVKAAIRGITGKLALIASAGLRALSRLTPRQRQRLPKVAQKRPRRSRKPWHVASQNPLSQWIERQDIAARPRSRREFTRSPSSSSERISGRGAGRLAELSRPNAIANATRRPESPDRFVSSHVASIRQEVALLREKLDALTRRREGSGARENRRTGRETGQTKRSKGRARSDSGRASRRPLERGPPDGASTA